MRKTEREAYVFAICVATIVSAIMSGRNVAIMGSVGLVLLCQITQSVARLKLSRTLPIAIAVVGLLHVTPLDVCVRHTTEYSLSIVPIIHEENTFEQSRDLIRKGNRLNVEFVRYGHLPLFGGPKKAILITVGWKTGQGK